MSHTENRPSVINLRKFAVTVRGKKKPVIVEAEYFRMGEKSELVFRIMVPGSYPIMVRTFNSDYWLDVQEIY